VRDRSGIFAAGFVAGSTVIAALWVYTYRVHPTIRFRSELPNGNVVYGNPRHISEQPWWSVYGALTLVLVGTAMSLHLLVGSKRVPILAAWMTTGRRSARHVA
jgi:hypothetical protein